MKKNKIKWKENENGKWNKEKLSLPFVNLTVTTLKEKNKIKFRRVSSNKKYVAINTRVYYLTIFDYQTENYNIY